jgi:hypothetical protein
MRSQDTHDGRGASDADRAARRSGRAAHEHIDDGDTENVFFVEHETGDAVRADKGARRGGHRSRVSVDELVAKGHSVFDRVRPIVDRVVDRVRSRLGRTVDRKS